ncbi:MAG TPA: transporter substrate-binding domain-containing protein [Candidatus Limnocylindrales bacterium]
MARRALIVVGLLVTACSGGPPSATPTPATPSPTISPTASPTSSPSDSVAFGGDRWDENAIEVDEVVGARYRWQCPPDGFTGRVWGTDTYATSSWVCTAAVHAGLITYADGGEVIIEIRPGQDAYAGSFRNGVTSEDEASWRRSFVFVVDGVAVSPTPTGSAGPSPSGAAGEYLQAGRLLICLPFGRVRFAELDASGNSGGVDVDIGEAIAAQLDREAQLIETAFEDLIPAIQQRQCDVTIGGQFITQGRLEVIDMIPYRQGTPHVVVQAGNPHSIEELLDLCGRSFAVVRGTVFVDMVNGTGDYVGAGLNDQCANAAAAPVDLREFDVQTDAEDALADGDVDAYAGNDFIVQDQPSVYALAVELPVVRNGIGHLLGAATLDADVRAALRAIIDDGSYQDILERYGVPQVALTERP